MSLPVVTTMKERKEVNREKMKIRVGSFEIDKVGEMEDNTCEGEIIRTRKVLVVCCLMCKSS